ncbi:MAG: hypothetical protein HETSPECPRED_010291 [Heterodermia speciosa]|uniref:Major facilitator superfamily (MFS) profile domain-containing protein n=1 Tax=Heterodermia speciosa TaxID=116794 RepID=A0A8H3G826_9LECA|nr:MAG: hypothetical protein HETSPECPRED_010291 [Heterodermia speciosa]
MTGHAGDNIWIRVRNELGLSALIRSSRDTKILVFQRFVRLFAYAGTTLVLALHLAELGNSDTRIGLFMTLTLLGDILLSLFFTFTADRLGRRNVLALGATAIITSGLIFGLVENYWVLLVGATIGVISPTANEIGPFRAIEESIVAQLTPLSERGDIYSWYSLIGIVGQALGTIICGWATQLLESKRKWSSVQAYRFVFFGYAVLGLVKLGSTLALSSACEKEENKSTRETADSREDSPLLRDHVESQKPKAGSRLGFTVTKDSLVVLTEVCFLQSLEAIAIGLMVTSWVAFFFNEKFGIQEGHLGILFFINYLIQASANISAASIAKRLGLVKTMALANLFHGATLVLIPIPQSAPVAILFFMLKGCANVIGLRAAFIASMYLPEERTAFMGITNVVRTASESLGPLVTGALAGAHLFWVAFLLSGVMMASYGLGILVLFGNGKSREERKDQSVAGARNGENGDGRVERTIETI